MSRLPLVEIPAFLEKLRAHQEEGDRRSAITRDAVLFALLTWVRTKELRLSVKSEFENLDGTEPVWRIPAARMKMETINGLYKAEVIWRQRSWLSASAVDMATLRWVDWFNHHRLFGPIGHIPPAEAEAKYYAANGTLDMVA